MPLFNGKSAKVRARNIEEMLNSYTFASDKPEKKRQQMAIAAAYAKAKGKKK